MSVFQKLSTDITDFLRQQGIVTPTEIQEKAIEVLLRGTENALLLSPTGSERFPQAHYFRY